MKGKPPFEKAVVKHIIYHDNRRASNRSDPVLIILKYSKGVSVTVMVDKNTMNKMNVYLWN